MPHSKGTVTRIIIFSTNMSYLKARRRSKATTTLKDYHKSTTIMIKRLLILSLLLSSLSCVSVQQIQTTSFKNKRVLFFGDSITQNGLYVSLIEYALKKANPEVDYDIISIGLSSETVSCLSEEDHPFPRPCLKDRIDRALKEVQPDIIVANYGMNDGIYHPPSEERFAAYKKGIKSLIEKVKKIDKQLIILTPTPFEKEMKKGKLQDKQAADYSYKIPYIDYDEVLQQYGKWLYTLATSNIQIIDLHKAIHQEKRSQEGKYFTNDGIHPNEAGHLIMANTFLNGIGHTSALSNNWATYEKDPLFQQIHQKRKDRSKRWLNYVGYTRGKTVRSISPKTLLILMAGQSNGGFWKDRRFRGNRLTRKY